MYAMFMIFSTEQWNETSIYNNWDFPSPQKYDEFWFDKNNTQFLYHALNYYIGEQQHDIASIRATPEISILR